MNSKLNCPQSSAAGKLDKNHNLITRGEIAGKTGIFPCSFVRIIDSFPGDWPGPGGDASAYLRAEESSGHEYDNTR